MTSICFSIFKTDDETFDIKLINIFKTITAIAEKQTICNKFTIDLFFSVDMCEIKLQHIDIAIIVIKYDSTRQPTFRCICIYLGGDIAIIGELMM